MEAGGELLLFDVGRGVTQRLSQLKIDAPDLDALFLTHLHADHTVGMLDLWLVSALGNRSAGSGIFGPEGTEAMMLDLRGAFDADSRIAAAANTRPTTQIAEGVVYTRNRVTGTAFRVDHAAGPTAAFGYRIDHAGRSVVISGDTRPSDNLVKFAQGADVLIHEVIASGAGALKASERAQQTVGAHTSPEDAGRIFDRVKPKLAIYTHVSLVAGPAQQARLAAELVPRTRATYAGAVELGEGLMRSWSAIA